MTKSGPWDVYEKTSPDALGAPRSDSPAKAVGYPTPEGEIASQSVVERSRAIEDYEAVCRTMRLLCDRGVKTKKLSKVRAEMYEDLEPEDHAEAQRIEKRNGLWCFHPGKAVRVTEYGELGHIERRG